MPRSGDQSATKQRWPTRGRGCHNTAAGVKVSTGTETTGMFAPEFFQRSDACFKRRSDGGNGFNEGDDLLPATAPALYLAYAVGTADGFRKDSKVRVRYLPPVFGGFRSQLVGWSKPTSDGTTAAMPAAGSTQRHSSHLPLPGYPSMIYADR